MDTIEIVILAIVAFFALLALGGFIANRRRTRALAGQFDIAIGAANADLASAHAADNGWDPKVVDAALRNDFAVQHPGEEITAAHLVEVIDPPGTDDDKAIFRVETTAGVRRAQLGRDGDHWHLESVS